MVKATAEELRSFFYPRSVAIIGASNNLDSISGRPVKYLASNGYQGKIFPVNPKYNEIAGFQCYPSVGDIPGEVDMAIVAVSVQRLFGSLEECAAKGVKNAVIFTSGFAEVGKEGEQLQERLGALAQSSGMRICGPNCIGTVNLPGQVVASFSPIFDAAGFQTGQVGLVSQSGALGHGLFTFAAEAGLGFSYVISSGNEVDLTTADYLRFMIEDPVTRVIMVYLEGWRDGEEFFNLARRASQQKKPILVLKVGRTQVGSKAAMSHTASLTGSDAVYDALFRQTGVIRADDLSDLVNMAIAFVSGKIPTGNGLAVVTGSGGAGILMADHAEVHGLALPEVGGETRAELLKIIPPFGSAMNPVDVTGQVLNDTTLFRKTMAILLADPQIHMITVMLSTASGQLAVQLATDIAAVANSTEKPVVVTWSGAKNLALEARQLLKERGVPCYDTPGQTAQALGALTRYGRFLQMRKDCQVLAASAAYEPVKDLSWLQQVTTRALTERDSKKLLQAYGIPVTREGLAATAGEAGALAEKIGFPVCVKVESPQIMHKTEAKAIRLNLSTREEVETAFREVTANARAYSPTAEIRGAVVQEMVGKGIEVILGVNNDSPFGPVIMFGLGGIFVEILKDVSRRIAPLTREDAEEMVREIKGYPLLQGVRGEPPADVEALVDTLLKLCELAVDLRGEIKELDINPLIVLPRGRGVKVADALVIRK
ncbi:MAG: acetate--CoA ligase family protein [Bacillota bacterium]